MHHPWIRFVVHLADKYGKPIAEILEAFSYEDLMYRMALFEIEHEEQEEQNKR